MNQRGANLKSITIHGLDDYVARMIKERATATGTSLNKTIKKLLEEALGVRRGATNRHAEHFEEFVGVWSDADLVEFDERFAALRSVDEGDWS